MPRDRMLYQVAKKNPYLFNFAKAMYGTNGCGWVKGGLDALFKFSIETGVTQGDIEGNLLYCIGMFPLLKSICDILANEPASINSQEVLKVANSNGPVAKAFVDDITAAAPHVKMIEVCQIIEKEGWKYGYFLNKKKTLVLLGQCHSVDETNVRKQFYINYGLLDANIRVHPKNGGDINCYGAKMLGSYIGTDSFILNGLRETVDDIQFVADSLMKYPDAHCKFTLLRKSMQLKINHLLRTTDPKLMSVQCIRFDGMIKSILMSTMEMKKEEQIHFDERVWQQCQLETFDGGPNIASSESTSQAAFIASINACFAYFPDEIQLLLTSEVKSKKKHKPFVRAFHTAVNTFNAIRSANGFTAPLSRETLLRMERPDSNTSVQSCLMSQYSLRLNQVYQASLHTGDINSIAWKASISDKSSAAWLTVYPNKGQFYLESPLFVNSLRRLLRIPLPNHIPGSKCNFKKQTRLDPFGDHMCACMYGPGRNRVHNMLAMQICQFAR